MSVKSIVVKITLVANCILLQLCYQNPCNHKNAPQVDRNISFVASGDTKDSSDIRKESNYIKKSFGKTVQGRDIVGYVFGNKGYPLTLILTVHGDERPAGLLIEMLVDYLKDNINEIKGQQVIVVPHLNSDGWANQTRTNANNVDINRNFPTGWSSEYSQERYCPGRESASEIETKVLIDILRNNPPDKVIVIHSPLHEINYDGPAIELAKEMQNYNRYPIVRDIGYETPGSIGSYIGKIMDIPVITLELSNDNADRVWKENKDALIAGICFETHKSAARGGGPSCGPGRK